MSRVVVFKNKGKFYSRVYDGKDTKEFTSDSYDEVVAMTRSYLRHPSVRMKASRK